MSNRPDAPPKHIADLLLAIFINEEKELRSGWRVIVFFIVFVLAIILLNGIAQTLARLIPSLSFLTNGTLADAPISDRLHLIALLFYQMETLAAALIASFTCARWLERRTLLSVGFKFHPGWWKDFAFGSLIGALSIGFAVGIAAMIGAVRFDVQTPDALRWALGFGYLFVFFLIAGAVEELLFRGLPLQALTHNIGALPAIAFTSILFGLAHIGNDHVSALAIFNTILAGVWLGMSYLITRSLWLATALHYSWNFVMAFVFGLNVSGISVFDKLTWLKGESKSPMWISGGDYGPEAGAAVTLALIVSMLVIWKCGWFRPTAEMLAAIRHGKPERPLSIIADDESLRA